MWIRVFLQPLGPAAYTRSSSGNLVNRKAIFATSWRPFDLCFRCVCVAILAVCIQEIFSRQFRAIRLAFFPFPLKKASKISADMLPPLDIDLVVSSFPTLG